MRLPVALPLLACLLVSACGQQPPPAQDAGQAAPVPAADPAQAVLGASQRFAGLRSFHAELTVRGGHGAPVQAAMDFVAPDRFRVQTPAGEQLIIGDTFYLQAEGSLRQVPAPPGLLEQWRSPLPAGATPEQLQATALGSQPIDGVPTHRYRVQSANGETLTYWVDAQGFPRQIERNGLNQGKPYQLRLRYSRFNDPDLRIELP